MKYQRQSVNRMVYSTGNSTSMCQNCGENKTQCTCHSSPKKITGDGIVRVRREVKGRKGKTVTTVSGVPCSAASLEAVASDLKKFCGSGGSAKDGLVIIQGDHRQKIVPWLEEQGYTVKLSGG